MATAKGRVETASWWVYVLVCADGTYYTGVTTDVERRLTEHEAGRGARYTRTRRPVSLLGQSRCASRAEALRLEAQLKRRPRAAKEALIRGGLDRLRCLDNLSVEAAPQGTACGSPEHKELGS